MITVRWCQHLFRTGKCLTSYIQSSQSRYIINQLYSCNKIHVSSFTHEKQNAENHKISTQDILKPVKLSLDEKGETTHFKTANVQLQQKNATFAAKVVDNSPSQIRPYFKLIRMDKPIGEVVMLQLYCNCKCNKNIYVND